MTALAAAAASRNISCPVCSPLCLRAVDGCPWLNMVEAGRSRLRGWLAAGSGTAAMIAGLAVLATMHPLRGEPVTVIPVTLAAPADVVRALAVAAVADPAPAIPQGLPQALQELVTQPDSLQPPMMPPPAQAQEAPDSPRPVPDTLRVPPEIAMTDLPAMETAPPSVAEIAVSAARPVPRPVVVAPQPAPHKPAPEAAKPARSAPAAAPPAPAGKTASAGASAAQQQGRPAAPKVSPAQWASQVVAKIRQVRQKRVRGSGTVTIGFAVAPNGALASVNVLRSSGNPELDRTGLDHIRRAAPFPVPPPGAGKGLSFDFTAR